eukprot:Hpha_TRINITY_DN8411_c0_g1::TRINITY_DN8411_c0_g1_i1::g.34710::m.34710
MGSCSSTNHPSQNPGGWANPSQRKERSGKKRNAQAQLAAADKRREEKAAASKQSGAVWLFRAAGLDTEGMTSQPEKAGRSASYQPQAPHGESPRGSRGSPRGSRESRRGESPRASDGNHRVISFNEPIGTGADAPAGKAEVKEGEAPEPGDDPQGADPVAADQDD